MSKGERRGSPFSFPHLLPTRGRKERGKKGEKKSTSHCLRGPIKKEKRERKKI